MKQTMAQIAKIALLVYAVVLTTLVVLAATVGPFQESYRLWSKVSRLETKYKESERDRNKLEAERARLLAALKQTQANWTAQQETIRALREVVNNPQIEKRLIEANQLIEKLSQERSVLIAKLNALRQEIPAQAEERKAAAVPEAGKPTGQ
ncbi:MAG: hypothetical protein HY543_03280 [Deltaproteobacteria bacterium]|nr:hypothetical protein [Deltaproteobacteria bacterium]